MQYSQKNNYALLITFLFTIVLIFGNNAYATEQKAEVALLGVFHFNNPGLDVVKSKIKNVLEPENQAYLKSFSKRIAQGFKPTKVLLECDRKAQTKIEGKFTRYLQGDYQLETNEYYQLGFRIAKASKAPLICVDEREVHWQPGELFTYMSEKDLPAKSRYNNAIQNITQVIDRMHQDLSMKELLKAYNSEDFDRLNKSTYLVTNNVGAEDNFFGASATSSWWHRNFRMYANIQKAASPGERVLVIGGQGHTAVLRDMLADDLLREAHSLNPYY